MNQSLTRWIALMVFTLSTFTTRLANGAGGSFARIESSFELPQVQGNPFDFTQNDVQVTFTAPDGHALRLPAFFDGGKTWRVRHTPDAPGKYTIGSITLNGKDADPQQLNPKEFTAAGSPGPGFIRIDATDKMRFAFDNGTVYYPLGYDLAWRQGGPPIPQALSRMGRGGVNWTRIWMNYWDGKNLDWAQNKADQPPLGQLDLKVAKSWDEIVDSAEASGVYIQLTLQHHGQYSTRADANWPINPWNKVNGGWMDNPVQFFTDPKAIALTKAKFHYIIARWGYSPAIMGWEMFNEVENSDAGRTNMDDVGAWHTEMGKFLRQYDSYKHLITTSSHPTEPRLWTQTDYYQQHAYPSDMLSAIANLDAEKLTRPYFLGEFGGPNSNAQANAAEVIHRGLWGSMMSRSSGAAQYWFWYEVEPKNLLYEFTSAQKFVALTTFPSRQALQPIQVGVETTARGPMKFGPGIDWAASKETHFTLSPNGRLEGVGGMSAFLQGQGENKAMFPSGEFNVDYPSAGTFAVHADQMTAKGARLELSVDGQPASSMALGQAGGGRGGQAAAGAAAATNRIDATLTVAVPAGKHTIRMENTGPDWIHIRDFTLTPYASTLGVLAKGNSESAVLWIYRRDQQDANPIAGTISVPGLTAGTCRIVWWDTYKGEIVKQETVTVTGTDLLRLSTPPITQDLAVFIEHQNT